MGLGGGGGGGVGGWVIRGGGGRGGGGGGNGYDSIASLTQEVQVGYVGRWEDRYL